MMKKPVLLTFVLVVVTTTAFYLGRMSAPAPRFISQPGDDLSAAFEEYQRGQRETLALMQGHPLFANPQMRAEAYRGVIYATVGSIRTAALTDLDHPRFIRAADWSAKSGLDNPDNNYYFAKIRDDEALIIRSHRSNASYQGIELGNRWFVSLDYETRTSSLTLDQAEVAPDGSYYFVVAGKDPGVYNWLDTEAHKSGLIMMRWQGLTGDLPESLKPRAWKVPLAEIEQHLPEDTRYISSADRRAQIAARRMALQRRDAG